MKASTAKAVSASTIAPSASTTTNHIHSDGCCQVPNFMAGLLGVEGDDSSSSDKKFVPAVHRIMTFSEMNQLQRDDNNSFVYNSFGHKAENTSTTGNTMKDDRTPATWNDNDKKELSSAVAKYSAIILYDDETTCPDCFFGKCKKCLHNRLCDKSIDPTCTKTRRHTLPQGACNDCLLKRMCDKSVDPTCTKTRRHALGHGACNDCLLKRMCDKSVDPTCTKTRRHAHTLGACIDCMSKQVCIKDKCNAVRHHTYLYCKAHRDEYVRSQVCTKDKCDEPRHHTYQYCKAHRDEYARSQVCTKDKCDEPRHKTYQYCKAHRDEYERSRKKKKCKQEGCQQDQHPGRALCHTHVKEKDAQRKRDKKNAEKKKKM